MKEEITGANKASSLLTHTTADILSVGHAMSSQPQQPAPTQIDSSAFGHRQAKDDRSSKLMTSSVSLSIAMFVRASGLLFDHKALKKVSLFLLHIYAHRPSRSDFPIVSSLRPQQCHLDPLVSCLLICCIYILPGLPPTMSRSNNLDALLVTLVSLVSPEG